MYHILIYRCVHFVELYKRNRWSWLLVCQVGFIVIIRSCIPTFAISSINYLTNEFIHKIIISTACIPWTRNPFHSCSIQPKVVPAIEEASFRIIVYALNSDLGQETRYTHCNIRFSTIVVQQAMRFLQNTFRHNYFPLDSNLRRFVIQIIPVYDHHCIKDQTSQPSDSRYRF
jgi:hypothetical protein